MRNLCVSFASPGYVRELEEISSGSFDRTVLLMAMRRGIRFGFFSDAGSETVPPQARMKRRPEG